MELVKRIKGFFYNLSLNKATKQNLAVQRQMINIEEAKTIGILYNATKPDEIIAISKFVDQLTAEKRKVYVLGYQNTKNKEDPGPKFFNKQALNFFEVPSDEKIDQFQKIKPDILICAFLGENLALEYIAASSPAKFRVGAFKHSKKNNLELTINIGTNQDLDYLLQQIHHFLKVINKK